MIHRLAIILQPTALVRLNFQQAGLVYALVAEANGRALGIDPVLPGELIIEPVEQCRREIAPHQSWSFGLTLLTDSSDEAQQLIGRIRRGLSLVGSQPARPGVALGGNFRPVEIVDLVTNRTLRPGETPTPISDTHFQAEIDQALALDRWTLRFTMPLRISHSKHGLREKCDPKTGKSPKPDLMDRRRFDLVVFLRKIAQRLEQIGVTDPRMALGNPSATTPQVMENHLCWCDVSYSAGEREKHLPGALGDIVLTGLSPAQVVHLVYSQYVHVGENTRFGHGRFRIAQLGLDPFACRRTISLRDLAFGPRFLDAAADRYGLEPGIARELARTIAAGTYEPRPPFRITIPSGSRERVLAIPHAQDRTLQRAVLDFLGPTLDRVLEASSLAYRQGRSRETAARRIQQATKEGYQWALKADFADFFDSVDHAVLRQRLRVYVADPALEGLIMKWVRAGSPAPDRGLPTGSVLSPLLANLFLDEFDVAIAASGGLLLRYADDFVILFKQKEQAEQIRQLAACEAENLRLKLNESKSALIDLREPFRFLGFEFTLQGDWTPSPLGETQPLNEIGWRDVSQSAATGTAANPLPGESGELATTARAMALIGPDLEWLDVRGHMLRRKRDRLTPPEDVISTDRVDHLFVAGFPTLHRSLLRHLAKTDLPLLLASDNGLDEVWVSSRPNEDPALVRRQLFCHDDSVWRLEVCRAIIAAKLKNYASLAVAYPARESSAVSPVRGSPDPALPVLRMSGSPDPATPAVQGSPGTTSDSAAQGSPDTAAPELDPASENPLETALLNLANLAESATSIEQLLGYEGAGANAWYSQFRHRCHHRFAFPGRRAPRAEDPLNILLNIGFTALHNWTAHFLRVHGFAPALGVLHEHRAGHASLASDLMEPFRHLVDAVVLDSSRSLSFQDFNMDGKGPFPTEIKYPALKRFRAALWQRWQTFHQPPGKASAIPYLKSLELQAINLRRHLLDRSQPLIPFHQEPDSPPNP